MKQFLDFLPLIVFFAFYKLYDIYVASGALIVATALALVFTWVKYRKVEKMTLITFLMVLVFGTLTLVFHNDLFIKWKVTVIYALFALALLISQWVLKNRWFSACWARADAAGQSVEQPQPGLGGLFRPAAWRTSMSPSGCRKASGSISKSLA